MVYIAILIGCVVGAIVGTNIPVIPYTYSSYLAIAIIAALDTVLGGISSYLQSALNIKGGLIDNYKSLGYTVKLEVKNNIEIKKYNGEMLLKYIK